MSQQRKMKSLISVYLFLSLGNAVALQQCLVKPTPLPSKTQLNMSARALWGSATSVLAGFVVFSQVATASIPADSYNMVQNTPTFTIAARGDDTLDFSMPSYDESTKGTGVVPKRDSPPSFNPFGDFQPDFKKSSETTKNELPEIKVPDFKAPEISIPDFKAPEMPKFSFDMPKMDVPKVDFDSSKLDMPKLDMPKLDMPKLDMPKFDMPKFDMPAMEMPKGEMPNIELPSFSLPKFGFPGGSDSTNSEPKVYTSQDVRDEAARTARNVYLDSDEFAKEIEARAREARQLAKGKLELAKQAKDLACETRPGGKWICLRNPFVTGF